MIVEGAVSWKSVKQTLTTSSTTEVEYVDVMRLLVVQYDFRTSFHL